VAFDVGALFEVIPHRSAQRAGSLTVDDDELVQPGTQPVVNETVEFDQAVVHRHPAQVKACGDFHAQPAFDAGGLRGGRRLFAAGFDQAQPREFHPRLGGAGLDFDVPVTVCGGDDLRTGSDIGDDDAVARLQRPGQAVVLVRVVTAGCFRDVLERFDALFQRRARAPGETVLLTPQPLADDEPEADRPLTPQQVQQPIG